MSVRSPSHSMVKMLSPRIVTISEPAKAVEERSGPEIVQPVAAADDQVIREVWP